jgi:hypothetical protein
LWQTKEQVQPLTDESGYDGVAIPVLRLKGL